MKGAVKKVHRLRRAIAWLLTAAIVAGNLSQLSVTTAYASETAGSRSESSSNAGKASPSEASPSEASPTGAARIIDVYVTQSAIEKVLKKDSDSRPELNEDQIPFEGDQKDLVLGKLYEELEGKTLVIQKKVGKAMYLVVVSDTLAGEPFFEADRSERIMQESVLKNIQVIGVNGYKDRDCEFRLRIKGDDLMITDAHMEEFAVKGENSQEEKTVPPSSAGNQSGSSGSSGTAGSQQSAVATEEETKIQETDAQGTDMEETQDQDNGETDPNPTETADGIDNRTGEETGNQKDEKSGEAAEESKAKDGEAEKEDQDHGVREENNGDSGIDS